MNARRRQRPYEKKQASKGGAIIFSVGLASMLATLAILAAFTVPSINRRLDNLPRYAQIYYRKLVPHPEYLPTPAPAVALGGGQNSGDPVELNLPPVPIAPTPQPEIPVAVNAKAESAANSTGDSLPQPEPAALTVDQDVDEGEDTNAAHSQVQLTGFAHQWQTWNNCGPATITTNMSYFGRTETQADAAQFLKPNEDDKNVNPHELAAYARTAGLEAIVRQGGSVAQIKQFLRNGLPVLAETWLVHDGDGLGHYRLITGYNDETGQFTTSDSLNGPSFSVSYDQFDADWRVFNRLYLVVYPPRQADIIRSIIGQDMDDTEMYKRLVREAQADIEANPTDVIAHFNLGDALTRLQRYNEAVAAFDQARQLGLHWRRLWYQFTPFEAYYAVGRYQDVLDLANATLEGTGGLEEAYYYQGLALYATGQDGVVNAFEQAIAQNPNFELPQEALESLQTQ